MQRHPFLLTLALALALPACDAGPSDDSLRDRISQQLADAKLSLSEAVEIAQAEAPGATVVDAELDVEHAATVYDIELYADGVEHEVHVSPDDGAILRHRKQTVDADDATELAAAAALVQASSGWGDLIAKAEAESGGMAFELEADDDDGVLEVETLTDAGLWEVELTSDGTVVKSEASDDEEGADGDDDDELDDDNGGDDDDDTPEADDDTPEDDADTDDDAPDTNEDEPEDEPDTDA
jgi:uncharacterized membrane protein YkoI